MVPSLLSPGSWMQLATLVDRQEFCLGNYGLKEHRSNAWQDFTCHVSVAPLWEIRIEGTCDSSLLEQRLWRFILKQDRQAVQVLASHWQWYSWSKCKLFISFCHWKLTHELSHGERPKVTIIIRIERMRHTARCVLPVRSVPSKSDFHDWISDVPKICCELESPEPLIEANILA